MKKLLKVFWLMLFVLWITVFPADAANKFFWATDLIGVTGALDTIDGTLLTSGDMAIVGYVLSPGVAPQTYFYKLVEYASNPPDEASPDIITPNTNAGTKRWMFSNVYAPAYVGTPDQSTVNYWTGNQYFEGTVTFRKSDDTPIMIFPSDPPTIASLPLVGIDGVIDYLETPEGCVLGGTTDGATGCIGATTLWALIQSTVFGGTTVETDQLICGTDTDGVYSFYSCGEATTYTEPETNIPICRTSAGNVGGCTNLTDKTVPTYTEPVTNIPICRTSSGNTGGCTNLTDKTVPTYTEPVTNIPICRTSSGNTGGCTNLTDVVVVSESSTNTFTNKTLDANATGNVLKGYGYIHISARAFVRRGAGVTAPSSTQTDFNFGLPKFDDATDEATNWIDFNIEVPPDVDNAVDLTAKLSFYLGGADTADHDYVVSMCNPAASAAADCTVGNAVNLAYTADGSGADGDVEYTTETTLTDWKTNVTAGRMWKVRLARDGDDGTNDASTVDSYPLTLTIKYGYTN